LSRFLHLKGNIETVRVFKGLVILVDEPSIFEEMEISKSEDFGPLFLLLQFFDILVQTHGKEEGKNGEL
jgi:hypothetical protein